MSLDKIKNYIVNELKADTDYLEYQGEKLEKRDRILYGVYLGRINVYQKLLVMLKGVEND